MLELAQLVLRAAKGTPLTPAEGDENLQKLADFVNGLAQLLSISLTDAGALKDNSVVRASIADRAVSLAELDFNNVFYGVDDGSADAYSISFTPYLSAYGDGMLFFVKPGNDNTGAATLKIRNSSTTYLATIAIKKRGLNLEAGEIKAGQAFAVMYVGGLFQLVLSSGSSSSGSGSSTTTNFTGLTKYEPDLVTLPGQNLSTSFTHGLDAVPDLVQVVLVCQSAEFGIAVNDEVQVEQFFDSVAEPAFTVQKNASTITVYQHIEQPYITEGATGIGQAITPASWKIKLYAKRTYNEATVIFPATEFTFANPQGAISYGEKLFVIQYGRAAAKSWMHKVNLNTAAVTVIAGASGDDALAQAVTSANMALLSMSASNRIVFTSAKGLFDMLIDTPHTLTQRLTSGSYHRYKPVWADNLTNPTFYAVIAAYDPLGGTTTDIYTGSMKMLVFTWGGSSYGAAAHGTNLNLVSGTTYTGRDSFLKFSPTSCKIMFAQYNPVKKRLYLVTSESGLLHIFHIKDTYASGSADISAWWTAADRYDHLEWLKVLVIPGAGGYFGDIDSERMAVEFDLTTGVEKAIVITRVNHTSYLGGVTRVPWRE